MARYPTKRWIADHWACRAEFTPLLALTSGALTHTEFIFTRPNVSSYPAEACNQGMRPQKSALLEVYEHQIERYLETFYIPEDYQAKILEAHTKLQALIPQETTSKVLERLAEFLKNVANAWRDANQEQRNRLARQLFEEIWLKDKQVIAVKPRPELEAFFRLSFEEWKKKFESDNSSPLGVATSRNSVTAFLAFFVVQVKEVVA